MGGGVGEQRFQLGLHLREAGGAGAVLNESILFGGGLLAEGVDAVVDGGED